MRRCWWSCLLGLTMLVSATIAAEPAVPPAAAVQQAGPADLPVGAKVVAKAVSLPLRVKDSVVANAPPGIVWQVRERRGDWLWLGRGWARRAELVPVAEASDFFAREVHRASTPAAYVGRCLGFLEEGQSLAALADAQSALRLDRRFAAAYVARSAVFAAEHDWDHALEDLDDAIRLRPTTATYYCLRGQLLERRHKPDKALRDFERALDLDPGLATAHAHRAAIYLLARDDDRALAECAAALRHDATDPLAHHTRGKCWFNRGDYGRAIAALKEAVRHDPDLATAYVDRGRCHARLGEQSLALADFNTAIRLDEKLAEAFEGRAYAHYLLGDFDQAMADRVAAQNLRPRPAAATNQPATPAAGQPAAGQPAAPQAASAPPANAFAQPLWANLFAPGVTDHANVAPSATSDSGHKRRSEAASANNAAWRAATSTDERYRDGARAIELAQRACELSDWKSAEYLDTLAAAYAEAGDFEQAVEWQQKAIELGPQQPAFQQATRERLELFRARTPYREQRGP
jgi:tetratricopeptide (TPR) repeat protein